MKSIILFITFITFLSSNYAQEWQRDVLFEMRQKYSSPKKFNKYCMYKYTLCTIDDRGGTMYLLKEDTMAVIKFYNTHNGMNRFVSLYYGGEVKTDFTEFELSQFDINKEKFELFLKKIK